MDEPKQDRLELGIIDTAKAEFYVTQGGFTGFRYNSGDYSHITLRRTMPIRQPTSYISVADHENKEIGIIRDMAELSEPQRAIVEKELDNRYYSPEVLEILSVKDKLGYVYVEMRIKNKQGKEHIKNCAIKDINRNIRMLSEDSLIIFDVDGNRYIVQSIHKLDKNSVRRLGPYLF